MTTTSPSEQGSRPAALLSLASVVTGVLNYGFTLGIAHYLPATGYAEFATCQTIILLATTVATAALPWLLAREVAQAPGDKPRRERAVWFCLCANAMSGVLAAALAVALTARFAAPALSSLLAASVAGNFLLSTWLGWAQGLRRYGLLAAITLAQVTTKVAVGLLAAFFKLGVTGILSGNAISVGALVIVGALWMRGDLRPARGALRSARLWADGTRMALLQATASFLGSVDILTSATVIKVTLRTGSYQFANALGRVPTFLAAAIATAAFPVVVASANPTRLINRSYSRLLLVGVPLCIGLATVPPSLLHIITPSRYSAVLHYAPYSASNGLASAAVIMQMNFLKAAGPGRRLVLACAGCCTATAVAVAAAALADGVNGIAIAASVTVWADVAVIMMATRTSWAEVLPPLRTVLAAGAMAAVLLLAHPVPAIWVVASAAVAIVAVVLAFDVRPKMPVRALVAK
ncbi:MAG TPA: oligosaccharide flippase family protein [Acidimicrobiales bacterium]|nr:oligosaccharide flippase family protein [Acidimicrobiales bacterium]